MLLLFFSFITNASVNRPTTNKCDVLELLPHSAKKNLCFSEDKTANPLISIELFNWWLYIASQESKLVTI